VSQKHTSPVLSDWSCSGVVYFWTATSRRSRGGMWSIIAPPFIPPQARGDLRCNRELLKVFQFLSIENPSVGDIMFLQCVRELGLETATFLAERFHWEHSRTAEAIRTIFFGRGRFDNTTSQNL